MARRRAHDVWPLRVGGIANVEWCTVMWDVGNGLDHSGDFPYMSIMVLATRSDNGGQRAGRPTAQ